MKFKLWSFCLALAAAGSVEAGPVLSVTARCARGGIGCARKAFRCVGVGCRLATCSCRVIFSREAFLVACFAFDFLKAIPYMKEAHGYNFLTDGFDRRKLIAWRTLLSRFVEYVETRDQGVLLDGEDRFLLILG